MNFILRFQLLRFIFILGCVLIISSFLFAQDKNPERIISLGPAVTRQLSLLGVEDKIVGVTTYCNIPNLADVEKVGTVIEADVEKILTLKPDLVIATALTNPKTIQKLENLNIKVVVFNEAKNFNQLCEQFVNLAQLVNKEKIAQDIISEVNDKVDGLQGKIKDLPKPKVIVQIGTSPFWVAPQNSLINDFIQLAGGINAGPDSGNGLVSREYVLKQNPDVIIIIDMGIIAKEEKEIWVKFESVNAVTNKRIYIFDSYGIGSPTPVSFVESLEEIFKLLHPEA